MHVNVDTFFAPGLPPADQRIICTSESRATSKHALIHKSISVLADSGPDVKKSCAAADFSHITIIKPQRARWSGRTGDCRMHRCRPTFEPGGPGSGHWPGDVLRMESFHLSHSSVAVGVQFGLMRMHYQEKKLSRP